MAYKKSTKLLPYQYQPTRNVFRSAGASINSCSTLVVSNSGSVDDLHEWEQARRKVFAIGAAKWGGGGRRVGKGVIIITCAEIPRYHDDSYQNPYSTNNSQT